MNSCSSGVFARVTLIGHGDAPTRVTRQARRTTLRAVLRNACARVVFLYEALVRRWLGHRRGELDMPSIVRSVLAHHAHRESKKLRASDTLYRDLGYTSLGLALAALDVEDILGIHLDADDLGSMRTVKDFLSATERAIGARRSFVLLRDGGACSAPPRGSRAEVS
jgi:acyl carrier protein